MNHANVIERAARRALLALARDAIVVESASREASRDAPASALAPGPSALALLDQRCGAFVTLTLCARLRGCIGRVEPDQPLRSMIPDVARLAAFADPRFPPVGAGELTALVIEISLLSTPVAVVDPGEVVVGRHGLAIASRGRRGLLLPQVAVKHNFDREQFLNETCGKAGLEAGSWREPGTELASFTADVFAELQSGGDPPPPRPAVK